jgi:hypothetical protein
MADEIFGRYKFSTVPGSREATRGEDSRRQSCTVELEEFEIQTIFSRSSEPPSLMK